MNDVIASTPGSCGDLALIGDAGLRLTDGSPLPSIRVTPSPGLELPPSEVTASALAALGRAHLLSGPDLRAEVAR